MSRRHSALHRAIARRYRHAAALQRFRVSVVLSVVFFLFSVIVSFFAIGYATQSASNSVADIVLSNIPAFDIDGYFVWGTMLLVATIVIVLAVNPKRIPFTLNSLSVFYLIRSGFTVLTHLGPFPTQSDNTYNLGIIVGRFFTGNDFFFSAHTGMPFLLALIFWRDKSLRIMFLCWSVFLGVIVLLGHLHYSIDVAAAFFITYTIFCIVEWLFPRDRELFYMEADEEV